MRLLEDHGTWPIERLLQPAIALAQEGFVVTPRVASDWARNVAKVSRHAGATKHLLKAGRAPQEGAIVRFPALAATLKRIAKDGRDGFYAGELAKDMVAELKALGGLHTLDDFAAQADSASYVTPISVPYRGVELVELPPSNHGIVALIMLKMLERLGKPRPEPVSVERYHLLMEAARLAFAMRDTFVADPDMAEVPVDHMLSDAVIAKLVARVDRKKHRPQLGPMPQPAGSDTVCFSVVDEKGMAVSFINSLFDEFGSGIVTAKTGIVLHNRGKGFVTDPSHPNCIAPGKRPLHTLVPAMVLKDGKPHMAFGVMGAHFQPMGHVFVMSNMFDYGMDPQEALDAPRVFFEGDALLVEETRARGGRHRPEAARPSCRAAADALGRRADRGDGPRARRGDRRLRRAQGWHGHRLLRAEHGLPARRPSQRAGAHRGRACRASVTAIGPSALPAS